MAATKKASVFTFVGADGKTYPLPPASKGQSRVPGRDLRDAALGGEVAMLPYMFKILEASRPTPEALNALYDLPQTKMLPILKAWGDFGDGDGTSLGE